MQPLYADRAGGTKILNAILLAIAGVLLAGGLEAFSQDSADAVAIWVTIVIGLLTFGFIRLILPDAYEVWPDHLEIVLPLWRWNITYDTVERVSAARWWQPYACMGVRLATAPGQAIFLRRLRPRLISRPNVVISPHVRAPFLEALSRAVEAYRASTESPVP